MSNEKEEPKKIEVLQLCNKCLKRKSWFERDDGSRVQWCYTCDADFLIPLK